MSATLTIGEVAGAAGLNASTLRYYERVNVLPPAERVGGQRRYPPETINQLRAIRAAQQAGLSLDEIRGLLRGDEAGRGAEELRLLAERKLPEIDLLIERAEAIRRWLELAAECRCSTLEVCALFADSGEDSSRYGVAKAHRVATTGAGASTRR